MIARRTVLCLGVSQLVCWGISYYAIGGFGDAMAADLGWTRARVHGGFSLALLLMGLSSPIVGGLIDRHGGRRVMAGGSVLTACGCVTLAFAHDAATYYAAWVALGLAMRATLYDAAFATLARLGGASARRSMSQITLLGGLASTAFWPIGAALAAHLTWRGALIVYAALALLTIPLHLAIPEAPAPDDGAPRGNGDADVMSNATGDASANPSAPASGDAVVDMRADADVIESVVGPGALLPAAVAPLAATPRARVVAGALYALTVVIANVLNAGMSAHMIGLLTGLGLAGPVAVWIATLRGVGQSSARLGEIVFGGRLHPLALNLLSAIILPLGFLAAPLAGLAGGRSAAAAVAAVVFAFGYGAGNGLSTITRGTLPLVLFDTRTYGSLVGILLVPGFVLSAAAPLVYALVIERFGETAALQLSTALSLVGLAAAVALARQFGRRN